MFKIETQTENQKVAVVSSSASTQTTANVSVETYTQTVASKSIGAHTQTAETVFYSIETQTTPPPKTIEQDQRISVIDTASDTQIQSTHSLAHDAGLKVEVTDEDDMELLEIEESDIAYEDAEPLEYALEEDDQYETEKPAPFVDDDGAQMSSNADNTYSDDMEDITTTAEYLLDDEELESDEKVLLICADCPNEFSTRFEFDQHQPFCKMLAKRRRIQPPAVTHSPRVLRVRSETHDKKRDKFCNVCNHFVSLGSTSFEKHIACHDRSMPMLVESLLYYRCGGCLIVFITAEQLEEHLNGSECTDNKATKIAGMQILKDRELMGVCQRLYSCTKLDENLFICDWCAEFTDETVSGVLDHFTKKHLELINDANADLTNVQSEHYQSFCVPHTCGVCAVGFNGLQETLTHVYQHSTVFQCPYNHCSDSYSKFYLLHQHLERNHMDDMEYGCTHCTAVFKVYGEFRAHLRTECQERTIPCDMCGKYILFTVFLTRIRILTSFK